MTALNQATESQVANVEDQAAAGKKKPLFKKLAQFQTPDGQVFETQKAAAEHMRKHLVVEAVNKLAAEFNAEEQSLGDFLLARKDDVLKAYDAAKVERPAPSAETMAKMKAAREAQLAIIREAKAKAEAEKASAEGQAPVADAAEGQAPIEANV